MPKKNILILLDRDGTLVHDEKFYLGKTNDWKKKIEFLPGIAQGIKKLRSISNVKIFMITNQPGVAVKQFKLLTEKRAHEVCREILLRLEKKKAKLDGYQLCPHARPGYVERKLGFSFERKFVCECDCMKPKTGMVETALLKLNLKLSNTKIYMIGDRHSDVETAHNAGGYGILIPFHKEPGEIDKVLEKGHKDTYIASSFLDAVNHIIKRESK